MELSERVRKLRRDLELEREGLGQGDGAGV